MKPSVSEVSSERRRSESAERLLCMLGNELREQLSEALLLAEFPQKSADVALRQHIKHALRTIDSALMYGRIIDNPDQLHYEPVHVGAVITDVTSELQEYVAAKGCEVELHIQQGVAPIDTHPESFYAGVTSLWQAALHMNTVPSVFQWHVTRAANGVRLSLTNSRLQTDQIRIRNCVVLESKSSQPLPGVAGAATDLLTAAGIFDILGATLKKTTKDKQQGFGVTFARSMQLSIL